MRRSILAALTLCLFAGVSAGKASACISFDRKAELRLVDRAIASRRTPAAIKKELRSLRSSMSYRNEDATKALSLIHKHRVVKAAPTRDMLPKGAMATGCG